MQKVIFEDLGTIRYKEAWDYQQKRLDEVRGRKLANRKLPDEEKEPIHHYLLFCEHPHVYTLGKSGSFDNLLLDEEGLKERDIEFFKINRGGDITYHGFGQIVGYPIFDLDHFFTDVHKYVRYLEEAVILTMAEYGLQGGRIEGSTGVWLDWQTPTPRKICAIGVHLSRWVTMHGFAFNVNTDMGYFNNIIPCGITDKGVTSLQQELGRKMDMLEVKEKLKRHFSELFGFKFV